MVSFAMTVALDRAADQLCCNWIAPNSIQTPMLEIAAHVVSAHDPA
jgi:hypothetical protein